MKYQAKEPESSRAEPWVRSVAVRVGAGRGAYARPPNSRVHPAGERGNGAPTVAALPGRFPPKLGRAFGLGLFISQSVAHGREFYP